MQGQWLWVLGHDLPDSPVPYFQPIERGHMSEGGLSDRYSPKAISVANIQMHHLMMVIYHWVVLITPL